MSAWLEESGAGLGITAPQRFEIDLVANEAVTNVISYGYPGGRQGDIELRLAVADGRVTLEIEDDGKAFNPLEADARHAPEGLDDAQVGGLGIHLIRMTMPDCEYRRDAERNVLSLHAPLSKTEELASAGGAPAPAPKQEG